MERPPAFCETKERENRQYSNCRGATPRPGSFRSPFARVENQGAAGAPVTEAFSVRSWKGTSRRHRLFDRASRYAWSAQQQIRGEARRTGRERSVFATSSAKAAGSCPFDSGSQSRPQRTDEERSRGCWHGSVQDQQRLRGVRVRLAGFELSNLKGPPHGRAATPRDRRGRSGGRPGPETAGARAT